MRKVFVVLAAILIGTWVGSAAPQCLEATMADYVALGAEGCQIGDKIFSNFTYTGSSGGGASAVLAAGLSVVPYFTPLNPGFMFSGAWLVLTGETQDSHITYQVVVTGGGFPIHDISAELSGQYAQGSALVAVAEDVQPGNLSLGLLWGVGSQVWQDGVSFNPTMGPLFVSKDILLRGGAGPGSWAMVSGVFNRFSETGVPEPLTLLLMGSGLLGLGALRWRKKS